MDKKLEEKIQQFAESTMLEGFNRFPGKIYQAKERITQLSESNLVFNRTVLERYYSSEIESAAEYRDTKYAINEINRELSERRKLENTFKWEYIYCPYFTITEMPAALIYNEHYTTGIDHSDSCKADSFNYGTEIKELELKLRDTEDPDEINDIKTQLISLGWNPEVEMTESNIEKAKNRIERIYTQEMNSFCDIINKYDDFKTFEQYKNTPHALNEAHIDSEYFPLYICVSENGTKLNSKILDEDANSNIYAIFVTGNLRNHILMLENENGYFTSLYEDGIFTFPANYKVFQVVSAIYETYQLHNRAIIYKIKSQEQQLDSSIINNYCRHMANNPYLSEADIDTNDIYFKAAILIE